MFGVTAERIPPAPLSRSNRPWLSELWKELPQNKRHVVLSTLVQILTLQASLSPKEVTHDEP